MKCEDARDLFSEYYDDKTSLADDFTMHLESCPECNKEFEEFRTLLVTLANIEEPDVPDGLRTELVSYTDGFYKGRRRHISITTHRFTSMFGSIAAAAAAVLIVWFTGAFDTSPRVVYESPGMLAEFVVPQAAGGTFDEVRELYDDFPLARVFEFEEETYDFVIGIFDEPYPFEWHLRGYEVTGEEVSGFIIPEAEGLIYFDPFVEPIFIEVGYLGSPVIRPRFATAIVFLIIGLFIGYQLHLLAKYIERKSDNAP